MLDAYTEACFVGSRETRKRRIEGSLTTRALKNMKDENGNYYLGYLGFRAFNTQNKEVVRDIMVEEAIGVLGDEPVSYLGFETELFPHCDSSRKK